MGPRTTRPRRRLTGGATVAALALLLAVLAPAAALATDAPCEPVLVTHTPEASTGNTAAVAITAQAIDREVDGWVNVAWQAAEGTELTAITATDLDGTTRTLAEASAAGSAVDVLALRFCGTTSVEAPEDDGADTGDEDDAPDTGEEDPPADTAPEGDGEQERDTSRSGSSGSGGSSSTGTTSGGSTSSGSDSSSGSGGSTSGGSSSSGSSDATSAASDDADDDATSTQEEDDAAEEAVEEEDAADDDADDTDDTDTAPDGEEGDEGEEAATTADTDADAEVLGVQLARDDAGIAGLRTPLLVILGSLILLGTGGAIWWNRRAVG